MRMLARNGAAWRVAGGGFLWSAPVRRLGPPLACRERVVEATAAFPLCRAPLVCDRSAKKDVVGARAGVEGAELTVEKGLRKVVGQQRRQTSARHV